MSTEVISCPQATPLRTRMVVVETIYYQPVNSPPSVLLGETSRYARELLTDEDPYKRRKVASDQWEPLELGWTDRPSLVLLRNDEGHFNEQPTAAERVEMEGRQIWITFASVLVLGHPDKEHLTLLPGETQRFTPARASEIRLRGAVPGVRYTLCLLPE